MGTNSNKTAKTAIVTVADTDFQFEVEMQDYNDFINGMTGGNDKIAPAHNLCVNTVIPDQEAELNEALKGWGVGLKIAGEITEQVTGKVQVTAKKQKKGQKLSSTTA